jgi:hypothetical protein
MEGSKLELVMNYEADGNRYEATASGLIVSMSFRLVIPRRVIPRRVVLQHCPLPLHQPEIILR